VTPRVSVCVPAYQAAANLRETLDSVWSQTFEDFELVIVDDGSSDGTGEIIAAQRDPRLRAFAHGKNKGQEATVADTVAHARAPLVKFLDADDLLHPDCLAVMVAAFDANPGAALAFSRRDILPDDPDDPALPEWLADIGDLASGFERIDEVNDGHELLRQYLRARIPGNWIAEPAGVMARRADLVAVGGYNRRVRQNNDVDLWLRLMPRGDVIYIDRPLFTYRLDPSSGVTGGNEGGSDPYPHWLDPLWTAEGLAGIADFPERKLLLAARRSLLRRAFRRLATTPRRDPGATRPRLRDLLAYLGFRVRRRLGRAEPLYSPIPTVRDKV
jgi:glycosyltransferase involved in cell wall biosynthesis